MCIYCDYFWYESAFFYQNVTREKLREALTYKKLERKMLMKLTLVDISDSRDSTELLDRRFFSTTHLSDDEKAN